jgi:hypothetical protein
VVMLRFLPFSNILIGIHEFRDIFSDSIAQERESYKIFIFPQGEFRARRPLALLIDTLTQ